MKLFTGCLAVGLLVGAAGAQAQMLAPNEVGRSPYTPVSDVGGPYAAARPETPGPSYGPGPHYGYGPRLLPPVEVYTVLRENGFSPLGIPRQRGFVYAIAVIDRSGESGRLIIDARDGRIVRFRPGYRIENNFNEDITGSNVPQEALPPPTHVRGEPRPPRSIPHVASRTVPVPKASPLAAKPEPQQQSAVAQTKPAEAPAAPPAVTTGSAPAKPVAQIAPTQDLPKVQGLD
ncbi:MAG: hypothetical protein ABJA75_01035 [Bradyrhizobium sp.]